MVEILKSKGMIGFVVFIIGICCFSANGINNQINMESDPNNNLVVINEK